MSEHRLCTRCVIDEGVPGAAFDAAGVCAYCHIHDALDRAFPTGEEGQARIRAIADDIKRAGAGRPYDCIVGVSGGTDSSYLVYLAKELGLRPLAVHFDNGWASEISQHNIKRAISKLGVDLQTYVVDWEEFKDILLAMLWSGFYQPDYPTDIGITGALYKTALQEGVKYILVGNDFRTEGKQPFEWTYGDGRQLRYIHQRYGKLPLRTFPNVTLLNVFYYALVRRIRLVRPLYYMRHDKTEARRFLEEHFGWEYYGGHHYESIFTRFVYSYFLPAKFGIDKRKITLSAQVRSGYLPREEALAMLGRPPLTREEFKSDLNYVLKKLGLTSEDWEKIMALPGKGPLDVPSYYPLIRRFQTAAKFAANRLLPWTPTFFFEREGRERN